ncbi:MAG: redoxin domain-containing protein [Acidimicrobiales bacterium]
MKETTPTDSSTPSSADPQTGSRIRPGARRALFAGVGVALAGILAAVLLSTTSGQASSLPAALASGPGEPGINTATASLLSLAVFGQSGSDGKVAHDFHLTDQNGASVSLSQFRGKAVVLSFNDDQCTDVCTLLAQDIVRADQDLGPVGRSRVVFLAVNVNPFYPQVQYVKQWSDQHDLGNLPNWYFSTGPVPTLEAIWKDYGVYVERDNQDRTVTHSAIMEFIGPSGALEAAASFGQTAVDVDPYSHGMAQMAVDTLPKSQRTPVAGPQATMSGGHGAQLTEQAPDFRLPLLGQGSASLGLASLGGHPVVINFWASSCVDCRAELVAFAQAAKQVPDVRFVGVDVADPSASAALALARQAGITYPVVADNSGRIATTYQVPDLPTTVFLGPGGKVVVRHPGTLTTENLIYALGQFFPKDVPGDN